MAFGTNEPAPSKLKYFNYFFKNTLNLMEKNLYVCLLIAGSKPKTSFGLIVTSKLKPIKLDIKKLNLYIIQGIDK
jgi:hypothetical protein